VGFSIIGLAHAGFGTETGTVSLALCGTAIYG
jgi:hypothetical protein